MDQSEKHINTLQDIVNGIGSMAMEYWNGSTERSAQRALDYLASQARQAHYLRMKIGADDDAPLVEAVQEAFGCGPDLIPTSHEHE